MNHDHEPRLPICRHESLDSFTSFPICGHRLSTLSLLPRLSARSSSSLNSLASHYKCVSILRLISGLNLLFLFSLVRCSGAFSDIVQCLL
ncbi:hypothetical protein RJT34_02812 [Clitoria ternatea]|uniref:Uncharacterized protein n=1 Tax=Clitoria ternatea TaxID=43366 RepID=A0AAN9KLR2_CLITE